MKRTISLFLALSMLISFALPASAKEYITETECASEMSDKAVPFVLVRGLDFTGLVLDRGEKTQTPAVGAIDVKTVVSTVFKALGSALKHFSFEYAVDDLLEYAEEILGKLECDENGNSVYNVSSREYPLSMANYDVKSLGNINEDGIVKGAAERYGAENTYYFSYDWRLDPLKIDDDLNELIERACRETGSEKVNLVCCSLGGAITMTYLSEYGYSRINKCEFLSTAFRGTYVASDLFCGRIKITGDMLYNFLMFSSDNDTQKTLTVLNRLGIFKLAGKLATKIVVNYKDKVYDELLNDIFGHMPMMWAIVLPEDYDNCIDYIFGNEKEKYSDFIAKTREYQRILINGTELLREMQSSGIQIAVAAGYNAPLAPAYERGTENGDGTLETAPMSGWATVAPFGKTLGNDYVAADASKLSPDRVVDTSTCLFPEYTWVIKNGAHVGGSYGTDYADFVFWILDSKEIVNVKSNPKYPRFMISSDGYSLASYTYENQSEKALSFAG